MICRKSNLSKNGGNSELSSCVFCFVVIETNWSTIRPWLSFIFWIGTDWFPLHISFSNWSYSDQNPFNWAYVTYSLQNFIIEINIQSVELAIPFTSTLSSLKFLDTLIFSGANLTGNIPDEIGEISALQVFDVSSNSLEGDIPVSVGKLLNLQDLVLNSNQLTRLIPPQIGNCSRLKNLVLFDNFLTGSVPVELGNLQMLEVIRVGGNKDLSGKIPFELGNCKSLQILGLAVTKVSGSIPVSLGGLTKLQTLSV
ncbi:putative non-specific serine/threonine protein kinase [Helianthus annuus]|nr:putative non-specific serine/threonine protein kinase [Helianthus annuus]